jgi:carboxylesterase
MSPPAHNSCEIFEGEPAMSTPAPLVSLMPGAEPFSFDVAGGDACVLVHGFTGSPNEVRELGTYLAEQGVSAHGLLLQGHGTSPNDLRGCSYREWLRQIDAKVEELCEAGKRVFLCGMSMGGTLALNVAARRASEARIAGVVSLAAPLRLIDWRLSLLPLIGLLKRWERWGRPDIKDERQWERHVAYDRFHIDALRQLLALMAETRTLLPQVRQPLLVMHSRYDHTVLGYNAELIMQSVSSASRRLVWLENSYHVLTVDFDAQAVRERVTAFIRGIAG